MAVQNIYIKVLNELEKRYIFTRSGLERRYNNMLKLKQSAIDPMLIKLINELLESYKNLSTEQSELDLDTFDTLKNRSYIGFTHSRTELVAISNSITGRANLRNYCTAAKQYGASENSVASFTKKLGKSIFKFECKELIK